MSSFNAAKSCMNETSRSTSKSATWPRAPLSASARRSASSSSASTPASPGSGRSGSRSQETSSARMSVEVMRGKLPVRLGRDADRPQEGGQPVREVDTVERGDGHPLQRLGVIAGPRLAVRQPFGDEEVEDDVVKAADGVVVADALDPAREAVDRDRQTG